MFCRILAATFIVCCSAILVSAEPDLAIGIDTKTSRPNAFIAWRNTQRILEIEVEVKNYGDEQASGQILIALLDSDGRVLLSGPNEAAQMVTLPPRDSGGANGKIVQIKGNLPMNLLIDELDRSNVSYSLRVEVVTQGSDTNLLNNVTVKTFNIPSKLKPLATQFREYSFRNTTANPLTVVWHVESSKLPSDWKLATEQRNGQESMLMPEQVINGNISITTPKTLTEGEHVDVRVSAIDKQTRKPVFQTEWFAIWDVTPPEMTGLGFSMDPQTGMVDVTLTANDKTSMIKEASGARVEYSTDGGVTFSSKIMFYTAGNFVGPTKFRAQLGPFVPGTKINIKAIAEDIAGNSVKRQIEPILVAKN